MSAVNRVRQQTQAMVGFRGRDLLVGPAEEQLSAAARHLQQRDCRRAQRASNARLLNPHQKPSMAVRGA